MTTTSSDPHPTYFDAMVEKDPVRIAAWVFPPQHPNDLLPAIWTFCIPGGTYTGLSYYDRQVPNYVPYAFSMARHFATNGIGSVVIDNIATGSSKTTIPSERVTAAVIADVYQHIVGQLKSRLATANLVDGVGAIPEESIFLAGVGHSMGAFILSHLQGKYPVFDAIVHLGMPYQKESLQEFYAPREGGIDLYAMGEQYLLHANDESFMRETRVYMRSMFYSKDVPEELIRVDERDATTVPMGLFSDIMTPEKAAQFAQRITCPVYIGFGQLELSMPHREVASFSGSERVTLCVLKGAAHCANFSSKRYQLLDDEISWLRYRSVHTRPPLNRTLV